MAGEDTGAAEREETALRRGMGYCGEPGEK